VIARSVLCVALAGAIAQLPGLSLAASAPAASEPQVSLDIDVAALPDDEVTKELQIWLGEHQTKILRDGGIEVVPNADVTIRVSVARYGDGDVHYRATIVMIDHRREGNDSVVAQREIECEGCRDSDLAARVGEETARLSGRILYAPSEPDASASSSNTEPTAQPRSKTTPPVRAIGPLGFSGIAALTLGVGATVAGGVLVVKPADARPVSNGAEVREYRPAGIALVSVGSAVVLAGVAMIAVDVIRRRDKRRMTLLPTIGPSGLALHVRF
jgi:hypothetical protein